MILISAAVLAALSLAELTPPDHKDLASAHGAGPAASSPDEASPDEASPDGASPDEASPDGASPDEASPDEASPDEATASPDATPPEARLTLRFADHLFLDGDWYRAITEYRRYLFLVEGRGPDAARAALAVGEALARGGQWDAAGRQADFVAARTSDPTVKQSALFLAGHVYLEDGRPERATPRFRLLAESAQAAPALRLEATWRLAWSHVEGGELSAASEAFETVARGPGPHQEAARAAAAAVLQTEQIPLRDPLWAGLLSVIPGLGHFYLGQWGVGLASLAWNGLFLAAATTAWLSGDFAVALLVSVFELGWYAGGIFGAVAGAFRHNRDAVLNWRDELRLRYGGNLDLPSMPEAARAPPGAPLRFGISF